MRTEGGGASTTAVPRCWVVGGVGGVEMRGREEEKSVGMNDFQPTVQVSWEG